MMILFVTSKLNYFSDEYKRYVLFAFLDISTASKANKKL